MCNEEHDLGESPASVSQLMWFDKGLRTEGSDRGRVKQMYKNKIKCLIAHYLYKSLRLNKVFNQILNAFLY